MRNEDILLDYELDEYLDTERRLERLDRRLRIRKAVSVSLVAVLLCCLVAYAVRLESKISLLSEMTPVIIYMNTEETSVAETNSDEMNKAVTGESSFEFTSEEQSGNSSVAVTENRESTSDVNVNEGTVPETDEHTVDASSADSQKNTYQYYVTKTGSKYHIDGCKHLSKSKIPLSYDEISEKGYKPCSNCIP